MASALDIRGWFPVAKPNPIPALGPWVGFVVEPGATIDLDAAEVRGFQGLFREPSPGVYVQDRSEAFTVALTPADVGAIRYVLDSRIAALGAAPKRTFALSLSGGPIRVDYGELAFEPTDADVQQIMGVVLARAKAVDTMGVYDDPAWGGAPIVIKVNGVPV